MKNWEKYEKEIKAILCTGSDLALKGKKLVPCSITMCLDCDWNESKSKGGIKCGKAMADWLYSDYQEPIELSRLEHEVLKHLKSLGCLWIARDEDKKLYAYEDKPLKDGVLWKVADSITNCNMVNSLFQFIKWSDENPTSIEAVLGNCTIKED